MSLSVMSARHVIGCDVGKATIIAYNSLSGQVTDIPNNPDALKAFMDTVPTGCLIVCEATGGYEFALLRAAVETGVPAHRANARRIKAFIRSFGQLAKTDPIDAQAITRYGQDRFAELPRWKPAGTLRDDLRALVRLRTQLVKQRTALTNQIKAPGSDAAKPHLQALIDSFCEQLDRIEAQINRLVQSDPAVAQVVTIIQHIPGCGPVTAVTVAALMPELGSMTGRQAASLAGLAPHPDSSGKRDGYRRTRGGRPEIKRSLFMAAMAARNHNPELKVVFQRLIDDGKKPIVAITALMRKLIVIINARIRDAAIPQKQLS